MRGIHAWPRSPDRAKERRQYLLISNLNKALVQIQSGSHQDVTRFFHRSQWKSRRRWVRRLQLQRLQRTHRSPDRAEEKFVPGVGSGSPGNYLRKKSILINKFKYLQNWNPHFVKIAASNELYCIFASEFGNVRIVSEDYFWRWNELVFTTLEEACRDRGSSRSRRY